LDFDPFAFADIAVEAGTATAAFTIDLKCYIEPVAPGVVPAC
jgi:hypothetical protein